MDGKEVCKLPSAAREVVRGSRGSASSSTAASFLSSLFLVEMEDTRPAELGGAVLPGTHLQALWRRDSESDTAQDDVRTAQVVTRGASAVAVRGWGWQNHREKP